MALGCHSTRNAVSRWRDADASLIGWSRSAEELRRNGQQRDLELVLSQRDDLDLVCEYRDAEIRPLTMPAVSAGKPREYAAPRTFA
jgi:phosphosulfolactate phosphohydrolase-like enzyme